MSAVACTTSCPVSAGNLIFLDIGKGLGQGRVVRCTVENKALDVLVSNISTIPDGVQVDTRQGKGQIYWTCMGFPPGQGGGLLMRAEADGSGADVIVQPGVTHTPKQLAIDLKNERLYWSDREGMRVMRSSLDGSNVEILVQTGTTDEDQQDHSRHCVGVGIDIGRGLLYWTQKGPPDGMQGRIRRANIDIPAGETADNRSDIQTLFAGLPEPIDIALDTEKQMIYWTDRGNGTLGNTLNSADISNDLNLTATPRPPSENTILAWEFQLAVGVSLDTLAQTAFVSDLGGSLYTVSLKSDLDGKHEKKVLLDGFGWLTGLVYIDT